MLLFPSTISLAVVVSKPITGTVIACDPSLGTFVANVYGKVKPPLVDNKIFTVGVLTGATSVPATFHVTVCDVPTFHSTLLF